MISRVVMLICIGAIALAAPFAGEAYADTLPVYATSWGTFGTGNGQFDQVRTLTVDAASGWIYVVDGFTARVQKFTSAGAFLTKWGSNGTASGQFEAHVAAIAVHPNGNVYTVDAASRVQVFDPSGAFLSAWSTSEGSGPQDLEQPNEMAIDHQGTVVYITDTGNHRVQKFTNNGVYLGQIGGPGTADGQFVSPYGVAVGSDGSVYVSDYDQSHTCIQKFSAAGMFLLKFGAFGTSGDGKLNGPFALACDKYDNVYVTDGNNQVQVFRPDGTFLARWGSTGAGPGQFNGPAGIGLDAISQIYVADNANNRVEVFLNGSTPAPEASWGRVKVLYHR